MVFFDKVEFCKDAEDFLEELDSKTREKVYYNIRKAQIVKDENLFKKLDGEIWEFRTIYKKAKIRLLAFKDKQGEKELIVITTHGIIKQTSKIPKKEIDKAKQIRKKYFEYKKLKK